MIKNVTLLTKTKTQKNSFLYCPKCKKNLSQRFRYTLRYQNDRVVFNRCSQCFELLLMLSIAEMEIILRDMKNE